MQESIPLLLNSSPGMMSSKLRRLGQMVHKPPLPSSRLPLQTSTSSPTSRRNQIAGKALSKALALTFQDLGFCSEMAEKICLCLLQTISSTVTSPGKSHDPTRSPLSTSRLTIPTSPMLDPRFIKSKILPAFLPTMSLHRKSLKLRYLKVLLHSSSPIPFLLPLSLFEHLEAEN